MSYLVATAWIKDEAPYLKEWIDFHRLQGFEKFYFYDKNSTDNTKEVLAPYVEKGIAEHRFYPSDVTTRKNFWVMRTTIDEFKGKHKWLFHHSIDEYMFCPDGRKISDLLTEFEDYSGVVVPWKLFNSSGHITKEPGYVIERFTEYIEDSNNHIKTIIQPDKTIDSVGNPHVYYFSTGFAVDENKEIHDTTNPHSGAMRPGRPYTRNKILNHHYVCMSRDEYDTKMNKGLLDISMENQRRREAEAQWNALHDSNTPKYTSTDLLKYVNILKGM